MDSTDPRMQPAPQQQQQQQQQPHHHHHHHHHHQQQQQQQQHTPQQRQPPSNAQQPVHHIQQQQTQSQQLLQQQQQPLHPPQHAQQTQSTGYASTQQQIHSFSPMQCAQYNPYSSATHYQRNPFPASAYPPNMMYQQPYSVHYGGQTFHQGWAPHYSPVSVSTAPTQVHANAAKPASFPEKRKKEILVFKDPITKQPIDIHSDKSAKTSTGTTNSADTTTPASTNQPVTAPKKSTTPVNVNTTTNNVTNVSSTDRTGTASPPSVPNILLQKVSEDSNTDRPQVTATPLTTPSVLKTKGTIAMSPTKEAEITSTVSATTVESVTETTTSATLSDKTNDEKKDDKQDVVSDAVKEVEVDKKVGDANPNNVDNENTKDNVNCVNDVNNIDEVKDCDEGSTNQDDEVNGETKLLYEAGQYDPKSNRNGKKKYSRQFMIDVCEKILNLGLYSESTVDISRPYSLDDNVDPFAPSFQLHTSKYQQANRQSDALRRKVPSNYVGRSSAGQERQRKIIAPSSSLTNEVELKTVSNPWRPGKEAKEEVQDDTVEVEVLKKKFRSILNKLTPNNFDNLATAVTGLHIDTETKLGEVIDIVFAKALAEPGYCVLYGQMCSHLKKISAGAANFANILLRRCQAQFNTDIYSGLSVDERKQKIEEEENPEKKKQMDEELYEDMFRCRMRSLGLIKFIGVLYKIEMLNDAIMFDCIYRLLTDHTSEESLECLSDLLETIGEKLDKSSQKNDKEKQKNRRSAPKLAPYQSGGKSAASIVASGGTNQGAPEPLPTLDPIFDQLHKIRTSKDSSLSCRIKFKLLDICELREKYHWQSKKTKEANPKTLDEIHDEHKEKLESERQKQAMGGARRGQEGNRGLRNAGGSSNQISSLGNDHSNRANIHGSASSQSIRDQAQGERTLQNNSDSHKAKEMHQKFKAGAFMFNLQPDRSEKFSGLRPCTTTLRPHVTIKSGNVTNASTNATATSNTTNSTTNS